MDACVFMAAMANGAMSICIYNAERDRHLLELTRLLSSEQWQPLTLTPYVQGRVHIPLKWLKGKPHQTLLGNDGLIDKIRFFVLREFDIGGARRSLCNFENDVICKAGRFFARPLNLE